MLLWGSGYGMMIQRDSSETVCFGQAVFYFYVGDI